ncbi:MAG: S1 RNA-binding domain-containing protein, partial [Lachnospiraceae bacterium]|nr:S1 RNA-binding domain-containing protein [Lachnospiraceae bacterium]
IFGIRPENINNPEYCPAGIIKAEIKAKVDVTELMGNEIFVYAINGNTQFVARVDPRSRYKVGDEVTAKIVDFNEDNNKISLSVKQLLIEEERARRAAERAKEDADVASVDVDAYIAAHQDDEEM